MHIIIRTNSLYIELCIIYTVYIYAYMYYLHQKINKIYINFYYAHNSHNKFIVNRTAKTFQVR